MSTIYQATSPGQVTARRQVYSPLEIYWDSFLDWRRRRKLRAQLDGLSDSELMDVGLSRGEIDYVVSRPIGASDPRSI